MTARKRRNLSRHPEEYKDYLLRRNFGITLEYYNTLLEAQGGVCAVCSRKNGTDIHKGSRTKQLAVDHDHATGLVRGLLCNNCNRAMGQLEDNPVLLRRAAEYLERHVVANPGVTSLSKTLLAKLVAG